MDHSSGTRSRQAHVLDTWHRFHAFVGAKRAPSQLGGGIIHVMDSSRDPATSLPPPSPLPLKERLYKTEAIVLSRMALGEADRILTIFTPRHGKVRVIAKGVRRPTSRLGPHLEYFAKVSLMLARGRDLDVVTGAETVELHLNLRTDLAAFGHASHISELLLRLTEDRQELEEPYELLSGSLRLLNEGVDPFAVTRHFELALLGMLGYRPELYSCVTCEQVMPEAPNRFIPSRGGMTCPSCAGGDSAGMMLSVHAQKYVRTLDRHGLAAAIRLTLSAELRAEVERFATTYIRFFTERDLQSLRIWHEMEPAKDAVRPDRSEDR